MTASLRGWTWGAEHEFGDWPLGRQLPPGWGRDEWDVTIVNSNGIAADPSGKLYGFGGEFNAPPTDTPSGQGDLLAEVAERYPECDCNYRSNLHIHVRVPGLAEDLAALKRLAAFNVEHLPRLLPKVEPIPEPLRIEFQGEEEYRGARRRWRRRRVSHHTVIGRNRLAGQLQASTPAEFHAREVPWSAKLGRPQWQCQPRQAVNLRQLLETDTIEFRHWPGTLSPHQVTLAARWCGDYLRCGLEGGDPEHDLLPRYDLGEFPRFPIYCHWQEVRYRATCHDGSIPRAQIERNIAAILAGEFEL